MGRADLERLSKDELIELVLRLQRPEKTSRTSSKPPSTDRKERREQARPGGAKPGHEGHSRTLAPHPCPAPLPRTLAPHPCPAPLPRIPIGPSSTGPHADPTAALCCRPTCRPRRSARTSTSSCRPCGRSWSSTAAWP